MFSGVCFSRTIAGASVKRCSLVFLAALLLMSAAAAPQLHSQASAKKAAKAAAPAKMTNDECLACHSDATLTQRGERQAGQPSRRRREIQGFDSQYLRLRRLPRRHQGASRTIPRRRSRCAPPAMRMSRRPTITAFMPRRQRPATPTSPSARTATAAFTNCCRRAIPTQRSRAPTFRRPAAPATDRSSSWPRAA